TRSLAGYQTSLENLIGGAQQTLRATADDATPLAQTLQRAPAALDSTVAASQSIDRTLPPLDTLIAALEPGARGLALAAGAARPAVTVLSTVLHRAQPALGLLKPAVSRLAAASISGRTLIVELA